MQVLVPAAPPATEAKSLRRRLDSLEGKVVGVIDNTKPSFDQLADEFEILLKEKYGVAKVLRRRKSAAGVPAPAPMAKELAEQCDAIVTGLGD